MTCRTSLGSKRSTWTRSYDPSSRRASVSAPFAQTTYFERMPSRSRSGIVIDSLRPVESMTSCPAVGLLHRGDHGVG